MIILFLKKKSYFSEDTSYKQLSIAYTQQIRLRGQPTNPLGLHTAAALHKKIDMNKFNIQFNSP